MRVWKVLIATFFINSFLIANNKSVFLQKIEQECKNLNPWNQKTVVISSEREKILKSLSSFLKDNNLSDADSYMAALILPDSFKKNKLKSIDIFKIKKPVLLIKLIENNKEQYSNFTKQLSKNGCSIAFNKDSYKVVINKKQEDKNNLSDMIVVNTIKSFEDACLNSAAGEKVTILIPEDFYRKNRETIINKIPQEDMCEINWKGMEIS